MKYVENKPELIIRAEGPAFEKHLTLRDAEDVVKGLSATLDLICAAEAKNMELAKELKKQLNYKFYMEKGCLQIMLDIIQIGFERKDSTIDKLEELRMLAKAPKWISAVIKLRMILEGLDEKKISPKYNKVNATDNGIVVDLNKETGNIDISDFILIELVSRSYGFLNKIDKLIKSKRLDSICFDSDKKIEINSINSVVLKKTTKILPDEKEVSGKLTMVNYNNCTGSLKTKGKIYPVIWDNVLYDKMQECGGRYGTFTVQEIVDNKLKGENAILKYCILSCKRIEYKDQSSL